MYELLSSKSGLWHNESNHALVHRSQPPRLSASKNAMLCYAMLCYAIAYNFNFQKPSEQVVYVPQVANQLPGMYLIWSQEPIMPVWEPREKIDISLVTTSCIEFCKLEI